MIRLTRNASIWIVLASMAALLAACTSDATQSDANSVTNDSGRVVVSSDPFALTVEDAEGNVVLTTLARTEMVGVTVDAPLDVLPWFTRCGKTPI